MSFKSRTVIEITESSVKVFQASFAVNAPLSFGGMIACKGLSDDAIAQKLGELRKTMGVDLNSSQVVLSIPRHYAILRYLDLPSENREELKSMVDLQAVNHLPYAREEVVVDFMPLHKGAEGYTKVMVVALPLETAMRFEQILEAARLTPHKMTISFVGQWQWYLQHFPSQAGVSVLLDLYAERSEICICDQAKVLVARATTLGIKEMDAKQYEEFLKQLDLTMASYVKEQLGPPIGQILVLSSMSNVEELKEQLQKHYTIPVQSVKTVQDVPVKKNFVWPSLLLQEWSSVTAILGLLQTHRDLIIDLIPSGIKAHQAMQESKKQGVRLGVVALAAFVSIAFCLSLNYFKQNSHLSSLEAAIKNAQQQVSVINQKKRQVMLLKQVVDNRIVVVDIISEIYNSIPSTVVLTNLTLTQDDNLSLQGYTNKAGDVNEMQRSLVGSPYFDTVNLDYVNKRVTLDGELNYFKITSHIKSKGQSNEEAQ